jgi:hypothetical protein
MRDARHIRMGDTQQASWNRSVTGGLARIELHGTMHEAPRGSDKPRRFLRTQRCGHPLLTLGKRNMSGKIRSSECLDEQKTERG